MEIIIFLLPLFASVIAKSIPNQHYIPSIEELDLVFGKNTSSNKTIAVLENPAKTSNKSVVNKLPLKKDVPVTVQINSRINTSSNLKQGTSLNDKVVRNLNSTGDNSKDLKGKPEKGLKIEGRVDDRVALEADYCPTGVRVGDVCVEPD